MDFYLFLVVFLEPSISKSGKTALFISYDFKLISREFIFDVSKAIGVAPAYIQVGFFAFGQSFKSDSINDIFNHLFASTKVPEL
ncbi:hypothetical protein LDC_0272 [sediment metagenome]|uniref:Uncharacterized protein n=1 Tax=sediment metagenome TaxID=749907 RepID=D9PFJ0_9ZZZZ